MLMIHGFHAILYSKDAEKDRAFFRDVLGFTHVDAGDGWLIFKLPPAELGIHPTDEEEMAEIYLMCDAIGSTVNELKTKGVECTPVQDHGWGLMSMISLPGGGTLGIYEPRHPTAIHT